MRFSLSLVLALASAAATSAAEPVAALTVHPTAVEIRHQRHPHAVQVFGTTADGFSVDLRGEAKFSVANPKIAEIDAEGWLKPQASGETAVTVAAAGQTRTITVKVKL